MFLKRIKNEFYFFLISIIVGVSAHFNWLSHHNEIIPPTAGASWLVLQLLPTILLSPLIFVALRKFNRMVVAYLPLTKGKYESYIKHDSLTFLIFLVVIVGASGIDFDVIFYMYIFASFYSTQILLLFYILSGSYEEKLLRNLLLILFVLVMYNINIFLFAAFLTSQTALLISIFYKTEKASTAELSFLFLVSGFAALIYQIAWQRVLFSTFGVNIESVTIIVSIFMFGLGIGSIIGGYLSKIFPKHLAHLFLLFEVLIAAFGIVSIPLIKTVGQLTINSSLLNLSFSIFALLLMPTMLMGGTLPILVAHINRQYKNIGASVGVLYSVNTVGSAVACFFTVGFLFTILGLHASTLFAVICNLFVGVGVYLYALRGAEEFAGT